MRAECVTYGSALLVFSFWTMPAAAQKYPEKNVRIVVAFATGAPQILGLHLAEKLRDAWGLPVVPDFRAGAGGNLASELVAKAPADAYTLLLTSPTIVISPSLFPKLAYDTMRDFAPITLLATVPNVMVIHPSVPAKTLKEFASLARMHPGKLNYGSGGVGSGSQLGSELFKALTRTDLVHVPYKGAAIAMTAMLSGEVDMVVSTLPATIPHVTSGRLRALAVLAADRVTALPNVQTTAEAGMPDLVVVTWYGLFAPAGVRQELIEHINATVRRVMSSTDTKNKLAPIGLEVVSSTPAEFAAYVRVEKDKWARVIKDAHIRGEGPPQ